MKKKIVIFFVALLLPSALFAQKRESLALFPFTGGNESEGTAIVSSLARQPLLRNAFNRTTLVTPNTIAAMNFEQRFQRNSGLTDADTIFELGKALNASHVIAGYITKLGDRNLVVISIMDVESLQQIAGDYRVYRTIEEIDGLIPAIVRKLVEAVPKNTSNLPGLSVPPFSISSGVNQNDAMVLAQMLSCDLANSGKFAVLPRTDSLAKVMEEHQRQRSGITDQDRIKRLGVGRNAQYVLSGSVQRLGTLNKFAADILDIVNGDFIDGYEESYTDFAQGVEVMPNLAVRLGWTNIGAPVAPTVSSTAPTRSAQDSRYIVLANARWSANAFAENNTVKNNSTAKFTTGLERIDGQEKEVLTLEVNLARGSGWSHGVFGLGNNDMVQQLQRGSGIRFKVLGDGKTWKLLVPTRETIGDWCCHEITFTTKKGRVVEIDIPFSKLKQPTWGKQASFVKNSITEIQFLKPSVTGIGLSTIKVFDLEFY